MPAIKEKAVAFFHFKNTSLKTLAIIPVDYSAADTAHLNGELVIRNTCGSRDTYIAQQVNS